jgi:hypothetical protein
MCACARGPRDCVSQMGLGKTLEAISVLAFAIGELDCRGPFLVVAPVSVLPNWASELQRFAPKVVVLRCAGRTRGMWRGWLGGCVCGCVCVCVCVCVHNDQVALRLIPAQSAPFSFFSHPSPGHGTPTCTRPKSETTKGRMTDG